MLTSCYEGKVRPLHLTPNISFVLRDIFCEACFAIAYTVHLMSINSFSGDVNNMREQYSSCNTTRVVHDCRHPHHFRVKLPAMEYLILLALKQLWVEVRWLYPYACRVKTCSYVWSHRIRCCCCCCGREEHMQAVSENASTLRFWDSDSSSGDSRRLCPSVPRLTVKGEMDVNVTL
jgi:hypothetical protein